MEDSGPEMQPNSPFRVTKTVLTLKDEETLQGPVPAADAEVNKTANKAASFGLDKEINEVQLISKQREMH